MAGKAGKHQAQAVQQLRARAERTADAGHAGTLMEGEGGGNIKHFVYVCLGRLGHAAARIGGKRIQITARAFGIKHAQRKGRFARTGYACHGDDLAQRDIHVNPLEIMNPRTADLDMVNVVLHANLQKRRCSSVNSLWKQKRSCQANNTDISRTK